MSTSSTFGAYLNAEQAAATETTTTDSVAQENQTTDNNAAASDTLVNQDGSLQTGEQAQQAATTEAVAEQAQEQDFGNINLDFSEQAAAATEETTTQTQQAQVADWRELIKTVDRKEVAKALGFNDFAIELDEHIGKGGQAVDYLNAKAVDYNKVDDITLMQREFAKRYPHLDPDEQQYLFNKKYGINTEFDDDDVQRDKRIALKADAYEIRQKEIANQANFKIPETALQQSQAIDPAISQQQQAEDQRMQQRTNFYTQHPATQNLITSKRVTIDLGEGVAPFNAGLNDPTAITNLFSDGDAWQRVTSTDKGEPNVELINKIALVARTGGSIFKSIFDYGKSVGMKKIAIDDGQNAKRPVGTPASATTTQEASVTKKSGTMSQYL